MYDLDSSSDEGGNDKPGQDLAGSIEEMATLGGASFKSWNLEDDCISNQSLRSWQVVDGASLKSWKLEDECTSNQSWEWLDDDCISNQNFSMVGCSASPQTRLQLSKDSSSQNVNLSLTRSFIAMM